MLPGNQNGKGSSFERMVIDLEPRSQIKFKWWIIVINCILLVSFSQPALAQTITPVVVRVVPKTIQVAVGQTVDVAVEVVEVSDLYAIDILMAYDPLAVEVVDQDPELEGIQVKLGTLLEPGFVILNLVDNSLGRLRLVMTQLNPATPKNGSGTLVVVTLKGLAPRASSSVEVLAVKLASPNGLEIPVGSLENASLQVAANNPGPTSTSIPAQDPGTPMPTPVPPTAAPTSANDLGPIPTFTPTRSFLNLPPTPLATQPPPASPTALPSPTSAPTLSPSATAIEAAASQPETKAQPSQSPAEAGQPSPKPPELTGQAVQEPTTNPTRTGWIYGLIGVTLAAGAGAYIFWRRKGSRID